MEPVEWPRVADARRAGFSGAWPVDKDYCIRDGLIVPQPHPDPKVNTLSRLYAPTTHSELPNVLAKLHAGAEEDVLRFVGSYGLLGFFEIASQGAKEPSRYGDPLPWVRQHAKTVRLIMNLWRLLQNEDELGLQAELAALGTPPIVRFAAGEKIIRSTFMLGAECPEPWPFALARLIVRSIINRNLAGIGPVLSEIRTELQLGFSFRSLLDVIYYQLAKAVTGGQMQRCAAKDCGGLFIQQDPRQRFCPLWLGVKGESLCSLRERQRTWRERQAPQPTQKKTVSRRDRVKARRKQEDRQRRTVKPSQQRTATKGGRHRGTTKR